MAFGCKVFYKKILGSYKIEMNFRCQISHYWHKHRLKQKRKPRNAMKSSVRIIAITTTVRHKTKSINYVEQILKKIQKKILSPLSSKMSEENLSFVVLLSLVQTRRKRFQVCTVRSQKDFPLRRSAREYFQI